MKPRKEPWGNTFEFDGDEEAMDLMAYDVEDEEVTVFLEEAHEALNRLSQKTNKRGRLMRQPRRAESWQ